MPVPVPIVEVAEDRDALCVWCPDREVGTGLAVLGGEVRAKVFVETGVCSFVEQVKIKFGGGSE
jgi:hypothetical protein